MSLPAQETFRFCPSCGSQASNGGSNPFQCVACDYTFYFGPTVAVGGILSDASGKVLLIRRARDPGKGRYGLPGGFVDAGEPGEQAVAREIQEEVNLQVTSIRYLATFVNSYEYRDIITPVLDIFYVCQIDTFDSLQAEPSEVSDYEFCVLGPEHLNNMAFESNRLALERYLQQ